jgi:hypothetical protein
MKNTLILVLFLVLGSLPALGWKVAGTRVNFQEHPLAVEISQHPPRFGWELLATENNSRQVAYELEMTVGALHGQATGKKHQSLIQQEKWWNSGKIQSAESQLVPYTGPALQPSTAYSWRVRVWNESGKLSEWSNWSMLRTAPNVREAEYADFKSTGQMPSPRWIGAIRADSARIPAGQRFFSRDMRTPEYRAVWSGIDSLSRKSILLRKPFQLHRAVSEAIVHVCGLGHYELTLNGQKVGDSEFAPLWSDYDKTVYYNTFDITSAVRKGENMVGVLLGNGFYNAQGGRYTKLKVSFGAPALWLLAEFRYDDGSREFVVSDADWSYDLSPVTFNDIYGGEDYDARLEMKGWNEPSGPDKQNIELTKNNQAKSTKRNILLQKGDERWKPVVIQEVPKGMLRPQSADPVKIMERYPPVSFKKLTARECDSASRTTKRAIHSSAIVFDMGQNLSGFPEIKVKGRRGDTITLIVSEALTPEGACDQRQTGRPHFYRYILKGEEVETWHPRFSYYGFRYIQVEGARWEKLVSPAVDNGAKQKKLEDRAVDKGAKRDKGGAASSDLPELLELNSCFVYNSAPMISEFESSSDLFNKTHRLIEMAVKSNMQAVFTDCPHREKLGWLEQVHLNGPGLLYNFDLTRLIPKLMQDMADAQQPNGMIPTIAPLYNIFGSAKEGFDEFGDSPEWGSTFLILPHLYEAFYGDSSLLLQYYPAMRRYVEYLISRSIDHELSFGLGDWYDYGDFRAGYSRNTPVPYVATAYYFYGLKLMAQLSSRLGNSFDAQRFAKRAEEVRTAFNKRWFRGSENTYAGGSQTALAMAVYLGIVDQHYRSAVIATLVESIQSNGNRLTTGDIGNRYLFQTLANNGLNELMFTMHHHEEAPGYGFQLKFGATTLTEQWDPRMGSSWNHFMMGQIDEWFFASLGGIRPGKWVTCADPNAPEEADLNNGSRPITVSSASRQLSADPTPSASHRHSAPTTPPALHRHFVIAPQPVGDLKFVKAATRTIYGRVAVEWHRQDDTMKVKVTVPVNCTAEVVLPHRTTELVGSGMHEFETDLGR